jgi:hypothetical protein
MIIISANSYLCTCVYTYCRQSAKLASSIRQDETILSSTVEISEVGTLMYHLVADDDLNASAVIK